jgi:hypothetical protein
MPRMSATWPSARGRVCLGTDQDPSARPVVASTPTRSSSRHRRCSPAAATVVTPGVAPQRWGTFPNAESSVDLGFSCSRTRATVPKATSPHRQPAPAGHGHDCMLAQVQRPMLEQTQYPTFMVPLESS